MVFPRKKFQEYVGSASREARVTYPHVPSFDVGSEMSEVIEPLAELIRTRTHARPRVVAVTGSVAAGKSTFCRMLQAAIEAWPEQPQVAVVSTDGFLLPNRELETRGIMHRKGFPESYDLPRMREFFSGLAQGSEVEVPVYSHETYDRLPEGRLISPDGVVIFEGVAALLMPEEVDFSVYLDAEIEVVEDWFVRRVLSLRERAAPGSHYWQFRKMTDDAFLQRVRTVWREVNLVNLREHILPTRSQADVVLRKGPDHTVREVVVRE